MSTQVFPVRFDPPVLPENKSPMNLNLPPRVAIEDAPDGIDGAGAPDDAAADESAPDPDEAVVPVEPTEPEPAPEPVAPESPAPAPVSGAAPAKP